MPSSGLVTQATPSYRRDPRGERAGAAAGPRTDPTPQPGSCSRQKNEPRGLEKWRPLLAAGAPFPIIHPGHATSTTVAQFSSAGSSWGVVTLCPYSQGAWKGAGTRPWRGHPHRVPLVSPHQSVGADVQTLVPQQRGQGSSSTEPVSPIGGCLAVGREGKWPHHSLCLIRGRGYIVVEHQRK